MLRRIWSVVVLVCIGGICGLNACDLSVSNAGPVPDDALDDSTANSAIVNGMASSFSLALGYIAYTGGIVSREIVGAGSINVAKLGVSAKQRAGILDSGLVESNSHWILAQQARWVAEDGVRRMRANLGDGFSKNALAGEALVDAGFAERLLGENMCVGIIDGGPAQSRTVYLTRAEAEFTEALAIAGTAGDANLGNAARAGRASVRVWLDNWAGAEADARAVPAGFAWKAIYSSLEQSEYNRIYASNSNQPERAHSVVGTFFESYYRTTGDPRTPWSTNPAFPKGTANVLWYFQTKYAASSSPINLVTSREMRLIIAESTLRAGDWQGAMSIVNSLRADVSVPPWPASNVADAWTALGRERAIELWLEGRRLGDLYRWTTEGVPGTLEDMKGRDLCFPVGISESNTNSNI
jgi:hypothetical protein